MREGEFSIVKDITGPEVRVHVNKETKLDGMVKVGDKIEARVTSEGHATSLTQQIPQHGTTPVMPGRDTTVAQQSSERLAQLNRQPQSNLCSQHVPNSDWLSVGSRET